jgi:hypothetical protein
LTGKDTGAIKLHFYVAGWKTFELTTPNSGFDPGDVRRRRGIFAAGSFGG